MSGEARVTRRPKIPPEEIRRFEALLELRAQEHRPGPVALIAHCDPSGGPATWKLEEDGRVVGDRHLAAREVLDSVG